MKIPRIYRPRVIVPFVTMADIAFLLLIFLIITGSVRKSPAPKLSLPEAEQFEKIPATETLELDIQSGRIQWNRAWYSLRELEHSLPSSASCIINADRDADFKFVYEVMEMLKKRKFREISFSVRRKAGITP